VLTEKDVREIYMVKHKHGYKNHHAASIVLCKRYAVSSKTIRDIWNGRCWLQTTWDLWSNEDRNGMSGRKRDVLDRTDNSASTKDIHSSSAEHCSDHRGRSLHVEDHSGQATRQFACDNLSNLIACHEIGKVMTSMPQYSTNKFETLQNHQQLLNLRELESARRGFQISAPNLCSPAVARHYVPEYHCANDPRLLSPLPAIRPAEHAIRDLLQPMSRPMCPPTCPPSLAVHGMDISPTTLAYAVASLHPAVLRQALLHGVV